jgi:hypothetical protein
MSFLSDYDIYASNNEAPQDYHRWAALSVMSSLVSRKVWIDQGIFTIYPNMYIIFVGAPGNGKSTAMMIAQRLVRAFGDIPIAPSSITKEAITKRMGSQESDCKRTFEYEGKAVNYTPMSFFANELTTLLGASPLPMIDFFTNIYDQEVFEVETKRAGCDNILGPFINILGCMTPEVTTSLLKQNIISGGFNRRCIFVNALKRGHPVPFPMVTAEMQTAWNRCLEYGKSVRKVAGQFIWDPQARDYFSDWYINNKHKKVTTHTDIVTQGYYVTKDVMLLKLAMLIALSHGHDLVLKTHHLQEGLKMLDFTEHNLPRVFSGTGRNVLVPLRDKLLAILEAAHPNPVLRKQMDAELYEFGGATEIVELFNHLKETGLIDYVLDNKQRNAVKLVNAPK